MTANKSGAILYSRKIESVPPPPIQEWIDRPREERLEHLRSTPDDLRALIESLPSEFLAIRTSSDDWSPLEVICHLRDIEDLSLLRFRMMIQMDEPLIPAAFMPEDKERWALLEDGATLFDQVGMVEQRQYARNDPHQALDTFAGNRRRVLAFLSALSDAQWVRRAIHPGYGQLDFHGLTGILAWHDDNHLAQLRAGL